MAKLNQIIAVEKGIKSRVYSEIGELHKINQKPELFNGFSKTYQKKDEGDSDLPAEKKKVQFNAEEILKRVERLSCEHFDVTARKDWTNCAAKADIIIGDHPLVKDVPVTYLLFLEKQLLDMRTFVGAMPVLDEGEGWKMDANSGLYKSDVVSTHRTKKIQKAIVLYDATPVHPAQTQLITEDIIAGYWNQEKHSGALPLPEKKEMVERIETLINAVKEAREKANAIEEITPPDVGEAVFNYILGE